MKKNKKNRTTLWFLLVIAVIVGLIVVVYHQEQSKIFHYENALDEVVVTTDAGNIALRELGYYFMIEEETVDKSAQIYNPKNPLEYWGLYIDNVFVSDEAKETAVNFCIRDRLYARQAAKEGLVLSEKELEEIHLQAVQMAEDLSEKQRTIGITQELVEQALVENALADLYVIQMAEAKGITMSEEVLSAYYGLNSKFFDKIKMDSNVKMNESLLAEIRLGTLTIN